VSLSTGIKLTETQQQRLRELGAEKHLVEKIFISTVQRDSSFKLFANELIKKQKNYLNDMRNGSRRPEICSIENLLISSLTGEGFVQVQTPIIISRASLEKMSIAREHSLAEQVFWLDDSSCLRPMLAPNLYHLLRQLVRLWEKPVRIFEVGPCFRKDSKGSHHLNEFTMLNLVELGLPLEKRQERIVELANLLMASIGIENYRFVSESSEVYGQTTDVVTDIELCSAAMGPHPLDSAWGIIDPWVGLGFGMERLVMEKKGYQNIQRAGRSLVYLNGSRLNI